MKEAFEYWLNYKKLSEEELIRLNTIREEDKIFSNESDYKQLEDELFSKMPFCQLNSENAHITVSPTASELIEKLFETFVNDDTLIISTSVEHPSVVNARNKQKNIYNLHYYDEIKQLNLSKLKSSIKCFKKVFVYIIGAQISTGEITTQVFFKKLKQTLDENNIESIFVLDDVHGMYIYPRDYSFFNFIIGTAHALIRPYDMGILIHNDTLNKQEYKIGEKVYNWVYQYITKLDTILERKDKLFMLGQILNEYFAKYTDFQRYTDNIPNIYAIKTPYKTFTQKMRDNLDVYEIRLEIADKTQGGIIRFRAQQFITFPDYLLKGLNVLDKILYTMRRF